MPVALPLAVVAAGALGAGGAIYASNKQASAENNALNFQKSVFDTNQGNLNPFIQTGQTANTSLANFYGIGPGGPSAVTPAFNAFTNLPSYQFPYQQGLRALNFNLNAQGKQQSGAQAKETQQYGQGLASTQLQQYLSNLYGLNTTGAQAAESLSGTNASLANTVGNTAGQLGGAQASGIVGATNALSNGVSNLGLYSLIANGGAGGGGGGGGGGVGGGLSAYNPSNSNYYLPNSGGLNPWAGT